MHNLSADALVGEDFEQQRVRQATVDEMDTLHAFLERDHAALLAKINEKGDFSDEIQKGLDEALKAFKATGTW